MGSPLRLGDQRNGALGGLTKPLAKERWPWYPLVDLSCRTQLPFDAWHDLGDPSFREIHVDTPPERLRIAHSHYDHEHISRCRSQRAHCRLPISAAWSNKGIIGRLFPWAYSFMGYLPQAGQLGRDGAGGGPRACKAEGADAAFLTPC